MVRASPFVRYFWGRDYGFIDGMHSDVVNEWYDPLHCFPLPFEIEFRSLEEKAICRLGEGGS